MRIRAILFVLSNLLAIGGAAQSLPLLVAIFLDDRGAQRYNDIIGFSVSILVALGLGLAGRKYLHQHAKHVGLREGFGVVTSSMILLSLFGMLPFLFCGATSSITDAFFETMSGFTTTGATVFPQVEVFSPGLHVWRSMTQWFGGMGIVVLSVALLPMLGIGGYRLLKAETPGGVAFERDRPRITDSAKSLWQLYLGLTAVLAAIFWALGMSLLDALCHAFTTLASGGFSTHSESIAYFNSPMIEWVTIVFMIITGINFTLIPLLALRPKQAFRNLELKVYLGLIIAATTLTVLMVPQTTETGEHIRDAAFQVIAIMTSTGYATADYETWPNLIRLMLVYFMITGACMGSTSGGVKLTRILVFLKSVARELHQMVYPRAVKAIKLGNKSIRDDVAGNMMAFGSLFILLMTVGVIAMVLSGYNLEMSIGAAISALGNTGPALGELGPTGNWSNLPDPTKWVMAFLMLCGRLELFSVVVLFTAWAWRR